MMKKRIMLIASTLVVTAFALTKLHTVTAYAVEDFIEVQAGYSRAVCLNWRWDHYRIPLPFTSIKISLKNCGITGDRNAVLPG